MPARKLLSVAVALTCLLAAATITYAQDLPRYHLQVGQQLVYHGESTEHNSEGGTWSEHHVTWNVDVLSQNKDGSWHIAAVIDTGGTFHGKTGPVPYERLLEASVCDLYPDGTIAGNDDQVVALSRLFPRLPDDAVQLRAGWDDQTADHSRMKRFSLGDAATAGHLNLINTITGGVDAVFRPGTLYASDFDPQTGIVGEITFRSTAPTATYSGDGKITLTGTRQLDAPALAKIAALATNYDSGIIEYQKIIASNSPNPTVVVAQAASKKSAETFLTAMLVDAAPGNPSLINAAITMYPDPPSDKDLLNAPAPDWTLKDLQGHDHSLKDYRGKVLLLDFGSRGCSWCMREIPQLIRLSKDFQDQPVAIIDMDLDSNASDAQFVMDAFHMPYQLLLAQEDLYTKYPCAGTPTVVIVDQSGVMRRRFVGYDNVGYYGMKAAIQSLLAPPIQPQTQ